MSSSLTFLLASFTTPIHIATNPAAMLWMFPLLLAIVIIYKATKLRVIFPKKFIREVIILFFTISLFMVLAGVALNVIIAILTG